jgi:hypothetical protein
VAHAIARVHENPSDDTARSTPGYCGGRRQNAELCAKYPDRFPAFVAAVNMHHADFSIAETDRAIKRLMVD